MAKTKSKPKAPTKTKAPTAMRVVTQPRALRADTPVSQDQRQVIILQTRGGGSSGTEIYSGYFREEYLINELAGYQAADQYDKMRRSDAKVKMALNAVKTPIIASPWEVQPAKLEDETQAKLHADFIEHVLFKDMDKPFSKTEALSLVEFGHAIFEETHKIVYDHPKFGSYVGLRSLGWRNPKSIQSWNLNPEDGSIRSIYQLVDGDLQRSVNIPGEFLVVNSIEKEGDNYEGVSLLRSGYGAWKRKNLYLRLMAIGNERNAVPTPTLEIPHNKANTTEYTNAIAALENYTSHENSYVTIPEGWKLDFIKSNFDPEKLKSAVELENAEIVSAFMANFLLLGSSGSSGSRAVSADQSQFFLGAIQAIADEAVKGFNYKTVPDLIRMKFGPQEAYPQIVVTGIADKAGKELAEILKALAESQVVRPDDTLEDHVRARYKFPKRSEETSRVVQPNPTGGQSTPQPGAGGENFAERGAPDRKKLTETRPDTKKLMFQAVGSNICEECQALDGKIFDEDDDDLPDLPLHPKCECRLEPQ